MYRIYFLKKLTLTSGFAPACISQSKQWGCPASEAQCKGVRNEVDDWTFIVLGLTETICLMQSN